ncbi:hypothetical protein ACHAWF_008219 [Thalassiosira exigua]
MAASATTAPRQHGGGGMNPHRRTKKRRRPSSRSAGGSRDDGGRDRSRAPQGDDGSRASSGSGHRGGGGGRRGGGGCVGALIFALCVFNVFDVDVRVQTGKDGSTGRRSLLSNLYLAGPSTLLPWAQHHLADVTDRPDPESETALFWHIPKSGGTTAKRLYQCMGRTLAHRVGADPRYGHDKDAEVVVFEPHQGKDWKVVNVDTTIKSGINRAKRLGLVQSHTTDLIFTMEPNYAGQQLYDEENKGRFLALFRHPVERAVSMFYYLQTATWERTYRPEWANMTVIEWAKLPHFEENYVTHKLVGKSFGDSVDETDLIIAKELVRQRFVVGLMGEMNESIRRFNIALGVDEESDRSQKCMKEFGLIDEPKVEAPKVEYDEKGERKLVEQRTRATDKKNSNKHPRFQEGSPEFEAVAARNCLDILLYKYIETLFESQKEILDSYLSNEQPTGAETQSNLRGTEDESAKLALLPPGSAIETVKNPKGIEANLADVSAPLGGADDEVPFFWHVPKCGGTTLQRLYWCMGSTVANEVGVNPKFGEYTGSQSKLVSFNPWNDNPGKVVNVDVSTHEGILEAKNRGFLASTEGQPRVDFVSTSEFQFASMMLFTPTRKARMFALFRHPIDRAVSKFYYLQRATWEPTYNDRWAKMTLERWASQDRGDNNWMVRHLVGKDAKAELSIDDLEKAKELIRTKFVVGLMDHMEESVHRFNLLLGIDENDPKNQQCIEEFSDNKGDSHAARNSRKIVKKNQYNSYAHPEAERGSPAWVSLAKIHMYDNMLYKYIGQVFKEQRSMFHPAAAVSAH